MPSCPQCRVSYPAGITRCPSDGERLVQTWASGVRPAGAAAIEPTESIVSPSRAPGSNRTESVADSLLEEISNDDLTRVERPGARSRSSVSRSAAVRRPRRPTAPEERIGEILGNYKILDLLGRGGMGCVYLAEHIKLGRRVALKLLRSDHAQRRDAVARFFQEARSVNRIRHRNIVDVTDFVELGDGTTFLVMELLDGVSLGRRLRAGGVDGARALALLIQICDGLAAAHAMGVVHRDLKPDNIFVVPTGDGAEIIKLLDFGVAKLLWREDDEDFGFETAAGAVVGTPTYMSPEQAGGLDIDARSDIYSLGAIMYEIFTGEPVFRGKSFGEYVRKHLNEQPVPPRATARGKHLDDRLEAIIMRCLNKRREDRQQDISELKNELMIILGAIETSIPESVSRLTHTPAPAGHVTAGSGVTAASQLGAPALGTAATTGAESSLRSPRRTSSAAWMPPPPQVHGPWPTPPMETAMAMGDLPRQDTVRRGARWVPVAITMGLLASAAAVVAIYVSSRDAGGDRAGAAAPIARPAAAPTPVATAIPMGEQPGPPTAPFVVRFLSTPIASVFAAGDDLPTCTTTPCDVTVDPRRPGPRDWRSYRLEREGYDPKDVQISLTQRPRTLTVTLRTQGSGEAQSSRAKRPTRRSEPGSRNPDPALVQPKDDPTPPPQADPPPPAPTPVPTKTGKAKTRNGKIDPSESLDPFGTP
ncbi:MAG TPA: serine/threonine-protein kinase [Kofleriaceae bacterium]|nr:serine/threonine-protein kinase [Kofleriaceae bacterium]